MLLGAVVVVLVALVLAIVVQVSTASDDPVDSVADRRSFCSSMQLVDPEAAVALRGADLADPGATRLVFTDAFVRGAPDDMRGRAEAVAEAMQELPADGFAPEVRDRLLDDLLALEERADAVCEEVAPAP